MGPEVWPSLSDPAGQHNRRRRQHSGRRKETLYRAKKRHEFSTDFSCVPWKGQ